MSSLFWGRQLTLLVIFDEWHRLISEMNKDSQKKKNRWMNCFLLIMQLYPCYGEGRPSRYWLIKVVPWICQNVCIHWLKLLYGIVKIDTWISLICYMNLSTLRNGFLWHISCYMGLSKLFHFFPALCQNKPTCRLTKISKLWTKLVEWVKVLNALGRLCLWQCFEPYSKSNLYWHPILCHSG